MATISNRAAVIAKTHKVLKKHFQPVAPISRPVLEQLLFACCLENAKHDIAEVCFARLQESFFDWNEVRVTTVRELSEMLKGLPDAELAATNLKHTLHSVFETVYEFSLEPLVKQNLGAAVKTLEDLRGTTPFAVSYVVQNSLGGHSIPICRGSLDVMYIAGALTEAEYKKGSVPGLERAIPKNSGTEFGSLVHQMGAALVASPFSSEVRNILLEIDPDSKPRMPKRKSSKKPAEPTVAVEETAEEAAEDPAKTTKGTKKQAVKKTTKKKTTKQAPAAKKAVKQSAKKTAKKITKKKTSTKIAKKASKSSKKSETKKIARRKPR
ncbi:MAG: hypothetical protein KDB27_06470 [Planctomycetales bacterium]|nr:hypothetical protein [Planctomycetales bacterium]